MKRYDHQPVQISVTPVEGPYLDTAYYLDREPVEITVGMGEHWTALACKEVYGRGVKTALERHGDSCVFDLSPAALLGQAGLFAALEGIYGGAYRQRFALSGDCQPQLTCYATGQGWSDGELERAVTLAEHILRVRTLVNRPANLLTPALFAAALEKMAAGLPVQAQVYRRQELEELGLHALLAVGTGSGNDPCLAVLRYTGAPGSGERLGLVGKGVTCDTGGYCLKGAKSMAGMKGDMAGGAAAAAAVCALAANGVRVNVTAVVPCCENRISNLAMLPGDVISSLSGRTIEVMNTDAEGRLILADALTYDVKKVYKNIMPWEVIFDGVQMSSYNGVPVYAISIWDRMIMQYQNNGTKLNIPHRAVFTAPKNLLAGAPGSLFSDLDIFFDRKARTTNIYATGDLGTLIAEDALVQVAC